MTHRPANFLQQSEALCLDEELRKIVIRIGIWERINTNGIKLIFLVVLALILRDHYSE